ncbi:hypothetical protein P5G51_003295 [Virgibacillus sp. 179-BFC.A HS]|uniref:Uncharacterized protein n=1 Tax=Tigheibacillus jepli TaxID=3035914 RepID=A0ABU5CFC0_9BACI|nr:hypothetical protein [Virgibacillus sp. 179-BFC.A HS]MDY0404562.1 hypothetical protein [Virgibacillus sp. 179-BFC.A HS]
MPYLFINQTADSPKAAGFEFLLKPFSEEAYMYRFYLSEDAKKVQAILYDPDTLVYKKMLLDLEDVSQGMNEGKIDKKDVPAPGKYRLLFMVQTENGSLESDEIPVEIGS